MKNIGKLAVLGAVLAASATYSFATLVTLDSNSGTVTLVSDTGGLPAGIAATNLPTATISPWIGPIGTSTWVGPEAGTSVGGGVVAPAGTYTYTDTFTDTLPSSGTITVLADDTTDVFLNGFLITPQAAPVGGTHCTVGTPNCMTTATYTLPTGDFTLGSNVLKFDVAQLFGSATGLDFEASITETAPTGTPEPSSLMLLGTGLMSAAGMMFRRRRQTV